MDNLLSARLQIDILRIQIACAAAKEYDAPWLEKSKSVMRDATGKFASKGSAIADDVKSTAKVLKDATAISADVVGNLVKDKDFRHRAGLEPGLPGAKAIERVLATSKLSPGLEKKIDKWINEISQELADTYGEDGDALHQAIRKGGAPLPKNAGLKDKLEFAVARYKAYEDALKDPEKYAPTPKEQTDLVGGAINSVVPVAVSMAIALTAEIALPLLTKGSIKWGHALTSAAVGVAVDLAVQKGLDAAEIENPVVRTVASLAAGMLAAGAVGAVGKKIAGKKAAEVAKQEAELAAKKARVELEKVSKGVVATEKKKTFEGLIESSEVDGDLKWTDYLLEVKGHLVEVSTYESPINIPLVKKNITDIMFDVEGTMNRQGDISSKAGVLIALKVKKVFEHIISSAEEGTIYRCSAWKGDGASDMRVKAYTMMGFSEPQEGVMLGIVKNGKLIPYYPPFIKILQKIVS